MEYKPKSIEEEMIQLEREISSGKYIDSPYQQTLLKRFIKLGSMEKKQNSTIKKYFEILIPQIKDESLRKEIENQLEQIKRKDTKLDSRLQFENKSIKIDSLNDLYKIRDRFTDIEPDSPPNIEIEIPHQAQLLPSDINLENNNLNFMPTPNLNPDNKNKPQDKIEVSKAETIFTPKEIKEKIKNIEKSINDAVHNNRRLQKIISKIGHENVKNDKEYQEIFHREIRQKIIWKKDEHGLALADYKEMLKNSKKTKEIENVNKPKGKNLQDNKDQQNKNIESKKDIHHPDFVITTYEEYLEILKEEKRLQEIIETKTKENEQLTREIKELERQIKELEELEADENQTLSPDVETVESEAGVTETTEIIETAETNQDQNDQDEQDEEQIVDSIEEKQLNQKLDSLYKNFLANGKTEQEATKLALQSITDEERQLLRDGYWKDYQEKQKENISEPEVVLPQSHKTGDEKVDTINSFLGGDASKDYEENLNKKIQEYVDRIDTGKESYDSIVKGMPDSMRQKLDEALSQKDNKEEQTQTIEDPQGDESVNQHNLDSRNAEIDRIKSITDPELRKKEEIRFTMANLFTDIGEASANKIQEYVDRVLSGKQTREQVIQGLPKTFIDSIDNLLIVHQYEPEEKIKLFDDIVLTPNTPRSELEKRLPKLTFDAFVDVQNKVKSGIPLDIAMRSLDENMRKKLDKIFSNKNN